ncbi:unnamed protein product [Vitrella brassicaformis CCMP3155]|uniref:Branchpoint-bridging protein n=1 Tax=Vitrella brassicaformis (strain CCMP3155) TaxID=1169540 RepID=A0A0G4GAC8_VITBC|nr:unnamed protein product [Vitrella brassicaformis CCMP3155]|eukprot:CEM25933.1 unnamed protein product [Vitrella brassicaformis CCMP3155]
MDQLMALVSLDAALPKKTTEEGRRTRWERKRDSRGKGRWGDPEDVPFKPPPFLDIPPGLTPMQVDQFLREQRLEELGEKLKRGEIEWGDPDIRPPSPPPTYDAKGTRTNTRDVRVKQSMSNEHNRLVEFMIKNVEGFAAPIDFKPQKKVKKIMIPHDKFPEYNFMGLIIGPRGCNHKRLEAESGANISIRGKGTQKEGKRQDYQTDEEAQMPMHVHIAADTEEKLDAVSLIEPLLDPSHQLHEEFKKKGMEQLALVNGLNFGLATNEVRCSVCQAIGHLAFECPEAQQMQTFKKPEVRCTICGDLGHVTMDCKYYTPGASLVDMMKAAEEDGVDVSDARAAAEANPASATLPTVPGMGAVVPGLTQPPPPPGAASNPYEKWKMDQEYRKMMSEISGKPLLDDLDPPPPARASEDAKMAEATKAAATPGAEQLRPRMGMAGLANMVPRPGFPVPPIGPGMLPAPGMPGMGMPFPPFGFPPFMPFPMAPSMAVPPQPQPQPAVPQASPAPTPAAAGSADVTMQDATAPAPSPGSSDAPPLPSESEAPPPPSDDSAPPPPPLPAEPAPPPPSQPQWGGVGGMGFMGFDPTAMGMGMGMPFAPHMAMPMMHQQPFPGGQQQPQQQQP